VNLYITPNCCDAMRLTCAIVVSLDAKDAPPRWALRLTFDLDFIVPLVASSTDTYTRVYQRLCGATPIVCPFCAAPLPAIEPRAVKAPVVCLVDGCCVICVSRGRDCRCLPRTARWQPQGGDSLDIDAMWAAEQARRAREDLL